MSSAPDLHPAATTMRLSPVDACRILAGEVFRRERRIENLRTGGLNTEKAVRQRLMSMAMELSRTRGLDDGVALSLYALRWNEDDPLTILEKTEALLERTCREPLATPGSLLRIADRTVGLLARLLVLQCLAGRLGRWAVRSGELLDARTARGRYRDLGTPEWSQYCRLTDEASAAFQAGDHRLAATKVFDADRLVRTPSMLLLAAVSLCRVKDFVGALWTVRTCLLEPEESFENEAAFKKAKTLELRLREIVEGRIRVPLDTGERELLGIHEGHEVTSVDIVEEEIVKEEDRWRGRHANVRSAKPAVADPKVLVTPKPVIVDRVTREIVRSEERIQVLPADRSAVTAKAIVTLHDPRNLEARVVTQPGSVELSRLVAEEKARVALGSAVPEVIELPEGLSVLRLISETFDIEFPPPAPAPEVEEDTYVPVGPSVDVAIDAPDEFESGARSAPKASEVGRSGFAGPGPDDFEEMTEVPPERELEARRADAVRGDVVEVPRALAGRVKDLEELTDVALELPRPLDAPITRWLVRDRQASRQERIVTERVARRVVVRENKVDILSAVTLPMSKETRETMIRSLDREEAPIDRGALEMPAGMPPLTRKHEVTQIVRERMELATDVLVARRPAPKR
jgi:hypothetical protein